MKLRLKLRSSDMHLGNDSHVNNILNSEKHSPTSSRQSMTANASYLICDIIKELLIFLIVFEGIDN